jgi:uncharacterized protein YkwD
MRRLWVFVAVSTVLVAGCSGGGGSGPTPSTPPPTSPIGASSTATPTPTASPTPTATPTAVASTAAVTGKVIDYDSGAGIAGATVTLGTASGTTDGMGNWTIASAPTDLQYFQVSASGYATYNSGLTVMAPNTSARTVKLIKPTTEETNTLAEMNSFRVQNGAPALLGFDEIAMEVARAHAQDMATQVYLSHWDTQGLKPYQRYALDGGIAESDENLTAGATNWATAESGFEAEKANDGGHYQTLVEQSANWAGLGEVSQSRYDQEIVTIQAVFDPATVHQISPGSSETIRFKGTATNASYGEVGADPIPTPLSTSQLNASPYNDAYSLGPSSGVSFGSTSGVYFTINVSATQAGYYYTGPVGGPFVSALALVVAK